MENPDENKKHIPVLLNETVEALALKPGMAVIDCTVGGGGHAEAILERTAPDGRLLGLDLDEAALETARRTLEDFGSRAMLVRESYRNFDQVLLSTSFGSFQAALLDLGYSSMEIDDPSRGFSFRQDGPLDMRYDRSTGSRQAGSLTAAAIVNGNTAEELTMLLMKYGEEREAKRIASAVIAARKGERIISTLRLAEIVAGAVNPRRRRGRIHPATKTFQALRIAVNDELNTLREALPALFDAMDDGGRLAVISFHSLEDRIVKQFIRSKVRSDEATAVVKKPITPSEQEVSENPRSRSAKLRIIQKND
ncbi:MAG: 16S rRNA (cytosine(1402)-N(4))-methyltransferase RsmH [Patescibacteria group bacterium]|nr:16S rRNA (cytosine(1402)-N(4))-methyltransferase RsmH [Patescibacteria group bacterium]